MGRKRHSMRRGKASKLFTKTAKGSHKKNRLTRPMRGGIRL